MHHHQQKCATCHAASGVLRCSQCRWVVYCSQACQAAHWRAGHRRRCKLLAAFARFRRLEIDWWSERDRQQLQSLVLAQGLTPDAMRFNGEVLLILLGLKSCLILSNLPSVWRLEFVQQVIMASQILRSYAVDDRTIRLELFQIAANLETPSGYELTHELVLADRNHPFFASATQALHLQPCFINDAGPALADHCVESSSSRFFVAEQTLASLLDYPVAMDECELPMIEVAYFARTDAQDELVTSYCADTKVKSRRAVAQHFARYQRRLGDLIGALDSRQVLL